MQCSLIKEPHRNRITTMNFGILEHQYLGTRHGSSVKDLKFTVTVVTLTRFYALTISLMANFQVFRIFAKIDYVQKSLRATIFKVEGCAFGL